MASSTTQPTLNFTTRISNKVAHSMGVVKRFYKNRVVQLAFSRDGITIHRRSFGQLEPLVRLHTQMDYPFRHDVHESNRDQFPAWLYPNGIDHISRDSDGNLSITKQFSCSGCGAPFMWFRYINNQKDITDPMEHECPYCKVKTTVTFQEAKGVYPFGVAI
jgi:hypothetical protein